MCVFPLLLQLALADTYLGSLSLSSFGSRRPLALTMAGSSGCGGPRATPGLGQNAKCPNPSAESALTSAPDVKQGDRQGRARLARAPDASRGAEMAQIAAQRAAPDLVTE